MAILNRIKLTMDINSGFLTYGSGELGVGWGWGLTEGLPLPSPQTSWLLWNVGPGSQSFWLLRRS